MSRIIGVTPVAAVANEYHVPGAFFRVQVNKGFEPDTPKPDFLMFMSIDDILKMTDFGKEFKITSGHTFTPKFYTYINAKRCAQEDAVSFEIVASRLIRWALLTGIISLDTYREFCLAHYKEYYDVCYRTRKHRLNDFFNNYLFPFMSTVNTEPESLSKLVQEHEIQKFMTSHQVEPLIQGTFKVMTAYSDQYSEDNYSDIAVIEFMLTYYMSNIHIAPKYAKTVYISHGYGGKEENKRKLDVIFHRLVQREPQYLFISPVHAFGEVYADTDYVQGLNMCLSLLEHCDEMWVMDKNWRESRGCNVEIEYCRQHRIPYHLPEAWDLASVIEDVEAEMK